MWKVVTWGLDIHRSSGFSLSRAPIAERTSTFVLVRNYVIWGLQTSYILSGMPTPPSAYLQHHLSKFDTYDTRRGTYALDSHRQKPSQRLSDYHPYDPRHGKSPSPSARKPKVSTLTILYFHHQYRTFRFFTPPIIPVDTVEIYNTSGDLLDGHSILCSCATPIHSRSERHDAVQSHG